MKVITKHIGTLYLTKENYEDYKNLEVVTGNLKIAFDLDVKLNKLIEVKKGLILYTGASLIAPKLKKIQELLLENRTELIANELEIIRHHFLISKNIKLQIQKLKIIGKDLVCYETTIQLLILEKIGGNVHIGEKCNVNLGKVKKLNEIIIENNSTFTATELLNITQSLILIGSSNLTLNKSLSVQNLLVNHKGYNVIDSIKSIKKSLHIGNDCYLRLDNVKEIEIIYVGEKTKLEMNNLVIITKDFYMKRNSRFNSAKLKTIQGEITIEPYSTINSPEFINKELLNINNDASRL